MELLYVCYVKHILHTLCITRPMPERVGQGWRYRSLNTINFFVKHDRGERKSAVL